jgi:hypothetical protein
MANTLDYNNPVTPAARLLQALPTSGIPSTKLKGAKAASDDDVADAFRTLINTDPDIQAVIKGVWGDGPRPSDTPKNLEKANDAASKQITAILKQKGIQLPDRTFVNPRSGALEGHRGWSGLPTGVKIAIIAGAGAATLGAGLAIAGGGAAAAGAGGAGAASTAGSGIGVTSGLGGLGAIGTSVPVGTGIATAGTTATTGGLMAAGKSAAAKLLTAQGANQIGKLAQGAAAGAAAGRDAENVQAMNEYGIARDNARYQSDYNRVVPGEYTSKLLALDRYANGGQTPVSMPKAGMTPEERQAWLNTPVTPWKPTDEGQKALDEYKKLMMEGLFNPVKLPDAPQMKKAGAGENILGLLGTGLQGYSYLKGYSPTTGR